MAGTSPGALIPSRSEGFPTVPGQGICIRLSRGSPRNSWPRAEKSVVSKIGISRPRDVPS